MARYFLSLQYDGTQYHGWQLQENASSVQGLVNLALSTFLGHEIQCYGCGRTDTGVHASFYVAHFDTPNPIDYPQCIFKLNCLLPRDIGVLQIRKVRDDAHARFDALSRSYQYHMHIGKDPFKRLYSTQIKSMPNIEIMQQGCAILLETKDFAAFSKKQGANQHTLCHLLKATFIEQSKNNLVFDVKANRFLRGMVRALVGTLLEIGYGKIDLENFKEIVALKDRSKAGASAKPQGLFLTEVEYPKHLYLD